VDLSVVADANRTQWISAGSHPPTEKSESEDVSWIGLLRKTNDRNSVSKEDIATVIEGLHDAMQRSKFDFLSTLLTTVEQTAAQYANVALITLLRTTVPVKEHISSAWLRLLSRAKLVFEDRGVDPSVLLAGLIRAK
jgi:hypothetical protein